ncbi:MAG TPA: hypothetical protein VNJ51_06455 [Candidatus Dormibacteraeota bacterium]|nr:hypothetical protein [Candidatus Dormibacteraeota bacterium]
MARLEAERLGLPSLRLLVVDHPVAQLPAADLEARGAALADEVIAALTEGPAGD